MFPPKVVDFREAMGISKKGLQLSHGWLEKFKARQTIGCHNTLGKASDVDAHGIGISQAKLPTNIATYDLKDVFNFYETGFYYMVPASKTFNVGLPRGHEKEERSNHFGALCNVSRKE